jgi:hypothetical protein
MNRFTRSAAVQAVPILISSFRDKSASVANAAVNSLTVMGTNPDNAAISQQIVKPIIALFERGSQPEDVYNNQVYYAERVLSQIGAAAVPSLLAAIRTGSPAAKKWSALTFGDMNDKEAVSKSINDLRALASSPDPDASWAAKDALNKLGAAA